MDVKLVLHWSLHLQLINNPSYYRESDGWEYYTQLPLCCGAKPANNLWTGVWESQKTGTQYHCEAILCKYKKRPCHECGLQLSCRHKPHGEDWKSRVWEIVPNHFEGGRGECTALKTGAAGLTGGGRQADAQFGRLGKIDWYECTKSPCTDGKRDSRWWKVR